MKKVIGGLVLACVILRLAAVAGAGEALGAWARDMGVDSRAVMAALNVELGGFIPDASDSEAVSELPERETVPQTAPPAAPAVTAAAPPTPTPAPTPEPEIETLGAISGVGAVHNRTALDIDVDALAAEGLSPNLRLQADAPQVLILHTHSSEAYTQDPYDPYEPSDPYRTEDKRYSVIRVGDVLAERFEAAGLTVLHDRELYDYPSYTGSYTRSGAAAEQYLAEYPSIRIVIDLHRDAIGSGDVIYKTQATLDGRSSAQVMLLVGTGENGLWHPNWKENLKLALYMQNAADTRWPTLMRPIELVSERYNQQLSTGSLLLEVGSSGNTLAEAALAAELFGDAVGPALAALIGE